MVRKEHCSSSFWDSYWSKPYFHYEKQHQFIWNLLLGKVYGHVLDLGCGSASCWKGKKIDLTGVDFSEQAIVEAKKNFPGGCFVKTNVQETGLNDQFDVIVLSGVVNYLQNLEPLRKEVLRLLKGSGKVLITINQVDDFLGRHWDDESVYKEFGKWGKVKEINFFPKIGFLIEVIRQ